MRRLIILLLSAFAGAVAAGIYTAATIHQLPPLRPGAPGQAAPPPLEFQAWFLELWLIFLFSTYHAGQFLYRRMGDPAQAHILRQSSQEYLAFLQGVAGCYLLASGIWGVVHAGSLRLSLFIGPPMIVAGVREWWQFRQTQRTAEAQRMTGYPP